MIEGKGLFFKMSSFGLHHRLECFRAEPHVARISSSVMQVSHADDREAFRWSTLLKVYGFFSINSSFRFWELLH